MIGQVFKESIAVFINLLGIEWVCFFIICYIAKCEATHPLPCPLHFRKHHITTISGNKTKFSLAFGALAVLIMKKAYLQCVFSMFKGGICVFLKMIFSWIFEGILYFSNAAVSSPHAVG